ncbi:hypothetical protein BJX64DRAFT_272094 [Aspergillus heterothallicus]
MELHNWIDPPSNIVYVGVSELVVEDSIARFAIVVRNVTDLVSFLECQLNLLPSPDKSTAVTDLILSKLLQYRSLYCEKFAAVAFPRALVDECPALCLQIWKHLDAIPYVIGSEPRQRTQADQGELATFAGWEEKLIDEQADSITRKCIRSFGIGHVPPVQLDLHGKVAVDANNHVSFVNESEYQRTVGDRTWSLLQHYAGDLRRRKVKVAFFSNTAHGRPDVSTFHALIRLSNCLGVDFEWYVPRPHPHLLDTVRRVQRILHCVEVPSQPLTTDEELHILEWVYKTAQRYWLTKGGPLNPRSEGGADVIIIRDAILSSLALIAKQSDPRRPVIFENHLHHHHRSANDGDGRTQPEKQTFEFLRARLREVDLLVSQEPKSFAPLLMPINQVGYIPVATDQLDGLNKPLHDWDIAYYGREVNAISRGAGRPVLDYPRRGYFLHLVQLLSNEGTIRLLDGYKAFYHQFRAQSPDAAVPNLLICHYTSVNNPVTSQAHASLLGHIQAHMRDLEPLISIVQLRPPDQLWNALVSCALAVVQLRDYEEIPELLLRAVQKNKPIIVGTEFAQYPFVQENDSAFTLDIGEETTTLLSRFMLDVATSFGGGNRTKEEEEAGSPSLGDQSTTVGSALVWCFLASELSSGRKVEPAGGDIFAMAGEKVL